MITGKIIFQIWLCNMPAKFKRVFSKLMRVQLCDRSCVKNFINLLLKNIKIALQIIYTFSVFEVEFNLW